MSAARRRSALERARLSAYALVAVACGTSAPAEHALPRALRGGPFSCEGDACAQAFPAYPDDGEWECIDVLGVVLCRGGIPPAGVRAGPPDAAFECGTPLAGDADGRRVCVDGAPDVPDERAADWRCRFDRDGASEVRRCERAPERPGLGAACDGACPGGLSCVAGSCALARRGAPDCWLDDDCDGDEACVLGVCTAP